MFHQACEANLTLDGGFVTMPSQYEDLGIPRDGIGGGTPRQSDLRTTVWHEGLLEHSNLEIRSLGVVCLSWTCEAQRCGQQDPSPQDRPGCPSVHCFPPQHNLTPRGYQILLAKCKLNVRINLGETKQIQTALGMPSERLGRDAGR